MRDKHSFISPTDLNLVTVVDKPQEAIERILEYERRQGSTRPAGRLAGWYALLAKVPNRQKR